MRQFLPPGDDSDDEFRIANTEEIFVDELSDFQRELEKRRLELFSSFLPFPQEAYAPVHRKRER
jgi:hypothetical protein